MQKNTNTILNMLFKKIFCLITFVLISAQCFSYDMEDLYKLSPKEQVDLWLEEFSYNYYRPSNIRCNQTKKYFSEPENASIFLPILLDRMKEIELVDYPEKPYSFRIVRSVFDEMKVQKRLTDNQKKQIAELYRNKIYEYISKHKKINNTVLGIFLDITDFEEDFYPPSFFFNPYVIKEEYEKKGIKDIDICWDDLNENCLIYKDNPQYKFDFTQESLKNYFPDNTQLLGKTGPCGGTVFYTERNKAWEYIDLESEINWDWLSKDLSYYFAGKDKESWLYAIHIDISKIKREDNDWRLPTPSELNWIYKYLEDTGAERPEKWYWTSESVKDDGFYIQRMSDGKRGLNQTTKNSSVIMIRTYKIDETE